jgi:hypothetical protein
MLSLALIWVVIYIVNNTDLSSKDNPVLDPNGVIPSYIDVGYMANCKTKIPMYNNWNCMRIISYSASQNMNKYADELVSVRTWQADYEVANNTHYTQFNKSAYTDPNGQNQMLIKDLQTAWTVNKKDLPYYSGIPDVAMLFNDSDVSSRGLNLHMQINNVANWNMHRQNGLTVLFFYLFDKRSKGMMVHTDGYIATMNYMNGKHMQHLQNLNDSVSMITSMTSLTVDSTAIFGFVESGLAAMSIIFFPVALSMGFPLLLYSLVLEEEEKILPLLKVNGLNTGRYWASIYIFYMILFTVTSTIFSVMGWSIITAAFFTQIPKFILTLFFLGWNLSQISFGIFLSTIISSSIYANLVGYLTSVLMTLAFSGISFTVFPNPALMPWYFYLIPHSAYIRFYYQITFDCVTGGCPATVGHFSGDTARSFWALYISTAVYTVLAVLLKVYHWDEKIAVLVKKYIAKKKRNNEGEAIEDDTRSVVSLWKHTREKKEF